MFELIIVWSTGEKDQHIYDNRQEAEKAQKGFYVAFGRQIEWTCINEVNKG